MATANDVLKIAKGEIGVKESPANSNNVKYNTWYYGKSVSGIAYPWCMAFIMWLMAQGGITVPIKTASCSALLAAAKKAGKLVTGGYKAGDVMLFNFSGGSSPTHTGILESVSGSTLTTIEGNTSTANDTNGGAVMRRTRKASSVVAAWRPNYTEVTKVTKTEAKQIIKEKADLSDATIVYLDSYRYGDDLLIKLATAMQ
ncbi:MAG: CHAP domain-containing protein [Clostridiales bacterium]|nr:CHAP domain-containing protein [Clostridiales bacterium]MDY4037667.1 CHAP domain-containing protein [Candidatus Pseudoscilispira sp.]